MFLIYDLIFLLYALVYLPYLVFTGRAYAGFGMRLGVFTPALKKQIKDKANIWVHAVSVGEVMVLEGFIDQLRKLYPEHQIIATVTTKTGYELAQQRLKDKALVIPSPIDFSFVTGLFVALINPKVYIAVETEIWPNLYRQLFLKKVPFMVINGRISDNSFGRYMAIRFLLKGILNQVSLWCMQSQRDKDKILALGAEIKRVVVTGNIKFDELPKGDFSGGVDKINLNKDECWWVAGSTHPGEEEIVLDVYSKIVKDNPQWRLVIAPRHIERVPQIIELIKGRGLKALKFSNFSNISHPERSQGSQLNQDSSPSGLRMTVESNPIIVVDTIGQLRSLYAKASLVFVGKSLCVGGGHNIIEPAFYGKAIVVGPLCANFRDIVACFKQGQAIVQVEDALTFEIAVKELCADASKREQLGLAAKAVIATNQGATKRSLDFLAGIFK